MASSDDAEETLTPVDFIQLQHYMECKYLKNEAMYCYMFTHLPLLQCNDYKIETDPKSLGKIVKGFIYCINSS